MRTLSFEFKHDDASTLINMMMTISSHGTLLGADHSYFGAEIMHSIPTITSVLDLHSIACRLLLLTDHMADYVCLQMGTPTFSMARQALDNECQATQTVKFRSIAFCTSICYLNLD